MRRTTSRLSTLLASALIAVPSGPAQLLAQQSDPFADVRQTIDQTCARLNPGLEPDAAAVVECVNLRLSQNGIPPLPAPVETPQQAEQIPETPVAPADAASGDGGTDGAVGVLIPEGNDPENPPAAVANAQAEQSDNAEQQAAPLTRQEARNICANDVGTGDRDVMRACMAGLFEEDGQLDLAQRIRSRIGTSEAADAVATRPEPTLTPEQEAARRQAEAALAGDGAAPAAAAAATGAATGEVQETVVTADDVRTSDEDFETSAVVTEAAPAESGLSRQEKFALGALGALAVGTLLNNRTRVVSNSGDRVIVEQDDGDLTVLKDDDALLRQAGSNVRTESFDDGSTRTIVTREDGSQIITVRDASLRVLRRVLIQTDGREYTLIDDTAPVEPVDVSTLPEPVLTTPAARNAADPLAAAIAREQGLDRRFTLAQVRTIPEVRALAPAFELNTVTFASGSAAIAPEQARRLTDLARDVRRAIDANPREVFLIEGHTDAVGDAAYNLALSDRRAETLALALNEYFGVPVENLVVQGYGERFLKIPTQAAEQANRRATVRQITALLQTAAAN